MQIEYATEAAKQGSATVGIKSKTHVVLVALKRSPTTKLSSYCEKVFKLDEHFGVSVTGLIADARYLARFMRQQALNHRYYKGTPISVRHVADEIGYKHHERTLSAGRRPFGVGILIAGVNADGQPQLFQTSPSGDIFDFKAAAIGTRSQSARTYLERHVAAFESCALDQLVVHALTALANTAADGVKLTSSNTSIAVCGVGQPFTLFADDAAQGWLDTLVVRPEDRVAAADGDVDDEATDAPVATD